MKSDDVKKYGVRVDAAAKASVADPAEARAMADAEAHTVTALAVTATVLTIKNSFQTRSRECAP